MREALPPTTELYASAKTRPGGDNYCAGIHFFEPGTKICLGAFCMSAFVVDTTAVHSEFLSLNPSYLLRRNGDVLLRPIEEPVANVEDVDVDLLIIAEQYAVRRQHS
jgi:hypothetical protein